MEKAYNIMKVLAWVLAFTVVIVGAYVLYNRLGDQVQLGGIATVPNETKVNAESAPMETESAGTETRTQEETEEPDYSAPDFTVLDREGNQVHLSDFEGKPVILNFWASWCGPCKSEMPDLDKAYLEYGEEIHFLMVNCTDGSRETVETASDFIDDAGYTFPIYFDTTYEAASAYGASSIPLTYFIDADGNLMAYYMGAMTADILQQGIDLIYPVSE